MLSALQRRPRHHTNRISVSTPYAERPDPRQNRTDRALQNAGGWISSHLLSGIENRRLDSFVQRVECYERGMTTQGGQQSPQAADDLRQRLSGTSSGSNEIARAFALARESARRQTGMRHFPVQLRGGAAMMRGALAEMQTGEGKSLTALLPAIAAAFT